MRRVDGLEECTMQNEEGKRQNEEGRLKSAN
jgi:hypothetical protein